MKLSNKLSALIFMLLLAAIFQGGVASYNLKSIDLRLEQLLGAALPSMNEAQGIEALVVRGRLLCRSGSSTADSRDRARRSAVKEVDELIAGAASQGRGLPHPGRLARRAGPVYDDLLAKLKVQQDDWDRLRGFPARSARPAISYFRGAMNARLCRGPGARRTRWPT